MRRDARSTRIPPFFCVDLRPPSYCGWGGEKSGVFHLVMMFIFVPQVTHFTGTVHVLTAKRLYPKAQSTPRRST